MVEDVQIDGLIWGVQTSYRRTQRVSACTPLEARLSDLSVEALDTLQLVMNHQKVRLIVDHGRASDLEVYQDLLYLTQNGYIFET